MVTDTGGITCHNCGQSNSRDGQFCVRCGDRLPDPNATTVGAGNSEHPWEPPAEWNPDPAWSGASGGGGAQSWDETSRTWGPSGAQSGSAAAYTPPPYGHGQAAFQPTPPPGHPQAGYQQAGHQQTGGPQQGTAYQGAAHQNAAHQNTPPPGYSPTPAPGASSGRSRTPLFAGIGALVVVALVVLGIVLVAGGGKNNSSTPQPPAVALNGEETKSPQAVLDDARVNLRTTSGVHAAGNVTSSGDNIRLDLDFTGPNVKGVLTISGNDVQIIKIGQDVYLKGDRDFYLSVANGDQSAVDAIGNKWLKATGDDAKEFNEFSLDGFADAFKVNDGDAKLNPALGRETLNGQPVVVLTQSDGSRLSVANTGKAYPLRLEDKSPDEPGQIDFTNFDKPVAISAPPTSDVLDLSKVG